MLQLPAALAARLLRDCTRRGCASAAAPRRGACAAAGASCRAAPPQAAPRPSRRACTPAARRGCCALAEPHGGGSGAADAPAESEAGAAADDALPPPPLDGWAGSLFPAAVGGRPAAPLAPGLYVVSTPVGNLEDVTLRALRTLSSVEAIYAEDTRTTSALLQRYGVRTPLRSFHAHNEAAREAGVLARLSAGAALALVSDAGTPLLSDPGALLAAAAARAGHAVFAVPGASALLAGLVVAGLPTRALTFAGFLPAQPAQRRRRLKQLAGALREATLALYVPPHKLAATLADAAAALGPERRCCVARELTKVHQEAWRSTLAEAAAEFAQRRVRSKGRRSVASAPCVSAAALHRFQSLTLSCL